MLAAVICLALVAIASLAVAYQLHRSHQEAEARWATDRREADERWTAERRELLNRIQAPQHIPLTAPADWTVAEPEPDEFALVGTIADLEPEDSPA